MQTHSHVIANCTTQEHIKISWDTRHRAVATKEQHNHLVHNIGSIHHYDLEDLHANQVKYIQELFPCRDSADALAHGVPLGVGEAP
ncbi:hypothetical protein D8674_039687 [Pyrus ussuriensis x Pyrus communis]|uniref:Uncharacterized protein n=1 Tax=Pyrus ussuriensis x Pyrus communis TaxID=2448454 RepID=A0A5N5GF83_9ROSA|nr:hypothetical protein D8674_039687 [Pyrus ussuriensis x Pyrus communis]